MNYIPLLNANESVWIVNPNMQINVAAQYGI